MDAVQSGGQDQRNGKVGVAGRVGAAQLHAAVVALYLRDAHQLAAVLAAPAHIAGGLVAAKAEVAVGQGIGKGRQLPAVGQDARHKAAGDAVGGDVALKQVVAVHVQREVDVQPAARLVRQGLGQKAGVEAVAGGHRPDDLLEHHHVVGGLQGACVVAVDLVLAAAVLVVAVLGGHAHLLHGQADVPAQVLACVQRGHVKIAAKINGDAGGAAVVIVLKQVELHLGAHVAGEAQLFELAVHLPQKAPAVAAKGRAVRLFHVAEKLHHPALGGAPGQDGHGGKVGPEDEVALLHVHKACNGAAVKADAVLQGFGQIAAQDGDVLLDAEDIAESKADEFDVVVLHKIKDVLLGRIAHNTPPRRRDRANPAAEILWYLLAEKAKTVSCTKNA